MAAELAGADLLDLVTSVPGVRGIEPGIGSTLDARIRRTSGATGGVGLHLDRVNATVTVEVGVDHCRPVRETVQEIQDVIRTALREALPSEAVFLVHVQSLWSPTVPGRTRCGSTDSAASS